MIKNSLKYIVQIALLLIIACGGFVYITAPKFENIEGLCFYHNGIFNEISRGEATFLRVESHDIWRFNIKYYTVFMNETLIVGSIKEGESGTLKFNFPDSGDYSRFETCPAVGRPLWKAKHISSIY